MSRQYQVKADQTIDTLNTLLGRGITRMAAIIRHSDRFYSDTPRMEAFMTLTEPGKQYAFDMGKALPPIPRPRLYASLFGRCIETAYLIDKGHSATHGTALPHTQTSDFLAPFYIKDIEMAVKMVEEMGTKAFIRDWFDKKINANVMEDPEKTADALTDFMAGTLQDLGEGQVALCVSHDWNIFPLKEFKLGVPLETFRVVDYLEGVVFYEEAGQVFIIAHGADPKPIR